jgi:hypothetical protein
MGRRLAALVLSDGWRPPDIVKARVRRIPTEAKQHGDKARSHPVGWLRHGGVPEEISR